LLGSEEAQPGEKKEVTLEDMSPALIRQLKRLLRSNE
jgi:hypothetical protein